MSLQRLQIEAAKLNAEIRALKSGSGIRQSHAISSASSTISDSATPVSDATAPDHDNALHRDYRGLGKCFVILSELWVRRSLLRRPCPPDLQSVGPWHPARCTNDAAWDNGIIAEFYFLLPSSYHEFIENSALFSEEVCTNLS